MVFLIGTVLPLRDTLVSSVITWRSIQPSFRSSTANPAIRALWVPPE